MQKLIFKPITKLRTFKNALNLSLLLAATTFSWAQNSTKVDQTNVWLSYNGNHKLTEKFGLHTEFLLRRNEVLQNPMQTMFRFGVDYHINKDVMVTAGWAHVETAAYGDFAEHVPSKYNNYKFNEQRIWEQLQLNHKNSGRFIFDSRFRLEQRWTQSFKNFGTTLSPEYLRYDDPQEGYWKLRHRVRYRFRTQIPLTSAKMEDNTLFLAIADEIFVNVGERVAANVFDQNRLSAAFGWRFSKESNIQVGYLNQFIEKGDGISRENNHTITVGYVYNVDFTKK
ncbi:DUF2490 domain-containing protein [Flavobacterium algicola]|uniref:DUF2490 domain-containing protein n=1 Tax=Flavobacterium algicola TaxID=556529 RepID=UPI001EFDA4CC|nr:DUF2490 domain-containing protein [Flavobacterium algicola]MCG9791557.1 DUF2490 domain-containing protein [Flavobacterium algicola]